MAQFFIPTNSEVPFNSQRTTIEGREFLLNFFYNQSEDVWYLSILDTNEIEILSGLKIVTNWLLLRRRKFDPRLPPGDFIAISSTDEPARFGELGLGKRVQLNYLDSEGAAELGLPVGAT